MSIGVFDLITLAEKISADIKSNKQLKMTLLMKKLWLGLGFVISVPVLLSHLPQWYMVVPIQLVMLISLFCGRPHIKNLSWDIQHDQKILTDLLVMIDEIKGICNLSEVEKKIVSLRLSRLSLSGKA